MEKDLKKLEFSVGWCILGYNMLYAGGLYYTIDRVVN